MSAVETEVNTEVGPEAVAIRRNLLLSGIVGGLLTLSGLAFGVRGNGFGDVVLGIVLLVLGGLNLVSLLSWQAPLLVADQHGIRLRVGMAWRGLPWSSIRQVVVERPDSALRDGRLVVVPRDPEAALGDLDGLAALHLRWNRFWYDAPLAIPLGMTTFVDSPDIARELRALSGDRVDVADLRGADLASLHEVPNRERPEVAATEDVAVGGFVEPEAFESAPVELPPPPEDEVPASVLPLRSLRRPVRAEVRLERPDPVDDEWVAEPDPEVAATEQPAEVETQLEGDELPEPGEGFGPRPVIGPQISYARTMLDMDIDELSERTRIRPHVLEAMEIDDFAPCGGDVYARGHLAAVARVLGLDVEPLTVLYDERYAQGPINARRVFEAELSSGIPGGTRTSLGGSNWTLLVSAVLCLTMVWGLARIFAGDPEQLSAAPAAETAGLAANRQPITSPIMKTTTMSVVAAHAPAHVVVRDRSGRILWSGDLRQGRTRQVAGLAPFNVETDNGGAVVVKVRGKDLGPVGMAGKAAAKNFG